MWNRLDTKLSSGDISDAVKMIEHIKKKGYEVVPISNLIYQNNYKIDNTGMQIQV